MIEHESVLLFKDYGKINIKLKQIMEEQGISRNRLSTKIGTKFEVVNKWYYNKVEKMDLDVLARLCFVLKCKVDDIIEYTPIEEKVTEKTEELV